MLYRSFWKITACRKMIWYIISTANGGVYVANASTCHELSTYTNSKQNLRGHWEQTNYRLPVYKNASNWLIRTYFEAEHLTQIPTRTKRNIGNRPITDHLCIINASNWLIRTYFGAEHLCKAGLLPKVNTMNNYFVKFRLFLTNISHQMQPILYIYHK